MPGPVEQLYRTGDRCRSSSRRHVGRGRRAYPPTTTRPASGYLDQAHIALTNRQPHNIPGTLIDGASMPPALRIMAFHLSPQMPLET